MDGVSELWRGWWIMGCHVCGSRRYSPSGISICSIKIIAFRTPVLRMGFRLVEMILKMIEIIEIMEVEVIDDRWKFWSTSSQSWTQRRNSELAPGRQGQVDSSSPSVHHCVEASTFSRNKGNGCKRRGIHDYWNDNCSRQYRLIYWRCIPPCFLPTTCRITSSPSTE